MSSRVRYADTDFAFFIIKNTTHTHIWSHQNQLCTEKRDREHVTGTASEPLLLQGVLSFLSVVLSNLNVAILVDLICSAFHLNISFFTYEQVRPRTTGV